MVKDRIAKFTYDKMNTYQNKERFLSVVLLILALLLGIVVRWTFIAGSTFPINDGGLFYQMVEDLLANKLVVPEFTTYNNGQIPYAYPPLTFYLMALIRLVTGLPLLDLFRIIPVILSILVMVSFYFFAKRILDNDLITALAVLFFGLLPRTFEWFLMGGGITRGAGFLFAILALIQVWDLFGEKSSWRNLLWAVLFSGACVLSHPETALFVVFLAGMLFLYRKPKWANIWKGSLLGVGVFLSILPWLLSVSGYHGISPFLGAGGTGHADWFEIKNIITLNFGFENKHFLSIYGVLSLVAIILRKDKLTYSLAGVLIIGYILFPRSGPNLLTIFISLLAAIGFFDLITLSGIEQGTKKGFLASVENDLKPKILLLFLIVYLFLGSYTYSFLDGRDRLSLSEDLISVFDWLDNNAQETDGIMFYPPAGANRFWWNDFASEWFPALTSKTSLTTVQGYEWLAGEYQQRAESYQRLRTCSDIGPDCIQQWENDNNTRVDYLVLGQIHDRQDFIENFRQDQHYQVEYISSDYLVLSKE